MTKPLTANTVARMNACREIIGKDYASIEEVTQALRTMGVNMISGQMRYQLITPEKQVLLNPDLYVPGVRAPSQAKPVMAMAKPKVVQTPQQDNVVNLTQTREVTIDAGNNFDASKLIPKIDPSFEPYGNYKKIKKILDTGRFFPLYITGPTGVGKSTMIKHICATKKKQFARVVITKETTDDDLFGRKTLIDGNVVWEDGILTLAAELGFPIVLDEISAGNPANLFGLYTILEGDRHFIKDGNKFVEPRPGFNIICTDNTLGRGDESGKYVGTNILNEAMLDRFKIALHQSYPTEAIETKIITNHLAANGIEITEGVATFAANVAKWAALIRVAYEQGGIDDVVSTRRLIVIAEHFSIFGKELEAIQDACTRFGPTTQSAFVDYYTKLVGGQSTESITKEITETEELFSF